MSVENKFPEPQNIPSKDNIEPKNLFERPKPKVNPATIEQNFDRLGRMENSVFPEQKIGENQIMKFKTQNKLGQNVECGLAIKDGNAYLLMGKNQIKLNTPGVNVNSEGFTKTDFEMTGDLIKQISSLDHFLDETGRISETLNS